jgi:DNA-binding response OmpR family regulator
MLFGTARKFTKAHEHLDRAQALFTGMKDHVHTAQVDDTRAKVLLAEGRTAEAERIVRSAVRILERGGERFDVLIVSYELPDIPGVELIRLTRALAHRQRTPLIMLTDYDVEEDAPRTGATTFLRKSGAAAEITETVARLLARRRRRG